MNALLEGPEPKKPKWLRKLERESWQAELIISGVAILGCLQLPGLIDRAEQYALLNFERESMYVLLLTSVYWKVFACGLITVFIFHFAVRALWIGMIGLNSVFPGGFTPNERYSPEFQENLRKDYGDVDGYIQRLDRLCSAIFGVGFGVGSVFLNFGLIGLAVVAAGIGLNKLGVSSDVQLTIALVFVVVFMALSLLNMAGQMKRFRNRRWMKKYHYKIADLQSRLTYFVNRRYVTTSLNIVSSYYADSKGFGYAVLLCMVLWGAIGGITVFNGTHTPLFIDAVYHRMANDSLRAPTSTVRGEETEWQGIYAHPVLLSTEQWGESSLAVWIPLPEREYAEMMEQCSVPAITMEVDDDVARTRRSYARRQRVIDCAYEYLSIQLNGREINDFSLLREYRRNAAGEQYGVRAFLPNASPRQGRNVLGVTTRYLHEETGAPREAYLPFFY